MGPAADGFWQPTLICRGETLHRVDWQFRRVGYPDWIVGRRPLDPSTEEELPFVLQPGEYEAQVGAMTPVPFTIERGATTKSAFELPLRTIQFTVADDLRDFLNSRRHDDKTVPITMLLGPAEQPQTLAPFDLVAQPGLQHSFFCALGDLVAAEPQIPKDGIKMEIPSGVYHWALQSTMYLGGVIDLRGRAHGAVEFSLANLPGLAVGRLELVGAGEDSDFAVEFADFGQRVYNLGVSSLGDPAWYEPQAICSAVPVAPGKYILFAPPGRHYIRIGRQGEEYWRVVSVPGDNSVEVPAPADGELTLTNVPRSSDFVGFMTGGNGLQIPLIPSYTTFLFVPQGDYQVTLVNREQTRVGPNEYRPAAAHFKLTVKAEATIDLSALKFEPFGSLTITVTGRCPVEGDINWWWLNGPSEQDGSSTCQIESTEGVYRVVYAGLEMAAARPVPTLQSSST